MQKQAPVAYTGRLGQPISLPQDAIQWLQADIRYTLAGKLLSTAYQPPPLRAVVAFSDGSEYEYRAIKSIVNGDIIANPFINNLQQARLFLATGQGRRIETICFEAAATWAYQADFSYTLQTIVPSGFAAAELPTSPVKLGSSVTVYDAGLLLDSWYAVDTADPLCCR